jgi:hypothetical protein
MDAEFLRGIAVFLGVIALIGALQVVVVPVWAAAKGQNLFLWFMLVLVWLCTIGGIAWFLNLAGLLAAVHGADTKPQTVPMARLVGFLAVGVFFEYLPFIAILSMSGKPRYVPYFLSRPRRSGPVAGRDQRVYSQTQRVRQRMRHRPEGPGPLSSLFGLGVILLCIAVPVLLWLSGALTRSPQRPEATQSVAREDGLAPARAPGSPAADGSPNAPPEEVQQDDEKSSRPVLDVQPGLETAGDETRDRGDGAAEATAPEATALATKHIADGRAHFGRGEYDDAAASFASVQDLFLYADLKLVDEAMTWAGYSRTLAAIAGDVRPSPFASADQVLRVHLKNGSVIDAFDTEEVEGGLVLRGDQGVTTRMSLANIERFEMVGKDGWMAERQSELERRAGQANLADGAAVLRLIRDGLQYGFVEWTAAFVERVVKHDPAVIDAVGKRGNAEYKSRVQRSNPASEGDHEALAEWCKSQGLAWEYQKHRSVASRLKGERSRRDFPLEFCRRCRGQGERPCDVCDPRRRTREPCSSCTGTKRATCPKCGVSGRLTCTLCRGTGSRSAIVLGVSSKWSTREVSCPAMTRCWRCRGQRLISCDSCLGTGTKRTGTCSACDSQRLRVCSDCAGSGVTK